jgi:type VI secretion system secreted protein VgrG
VCRSRVVALALTLSAACGGAPARVVQAPADVPGPASAQAAPIVQSGYRYAHESTSAKPLTPRDEEAPPVWFATALGWKPFQLVALSGREELHRAFEYQVQIRVSDPQLESAALLGTLATIGVRSGGQTAYYSGYVSQVDQPPRAESTAHERGTAQRTLDLTLIPFTGLLTRRADCAVFDQHDVPRVLTRFLEQRPFAAFRFQLLRRYPQQPYFVQYREADQNFLQRLIEHVGLISTFEHGPAGHTLLLFDDTSELGASLRHVRLDANALDHVRSSQQLGPARYVLRMSGPGASATELEGSYGPSDPGANDLEIYDYEGSALSAADAAFYARLRLEEQLSSDQTLRASARDVVLRPLDTIELSGHGALNGNYRVLSVTLQLRVVAAAPVLALEFEATPLDQPLRPARRTAWPLIDGPQVVRVVESAAHDSSQIKVHLPWARAAPALNELWVPLARMALDASGAAPAVGSEVLLHFLDGDPSRPLVTGLVRVK